MAERSAGRRIRRVLLAVTVVVLLGVVMVSMQRRLIYFPAGAPPPVEQVLPEATQVAITTEDGLELAAWHLPAGPTAVMVLPGNAGNREGRVPLARALADAGLSVLLVDYRGYGGNPGRPSETGLAADARAALAWLDGQPGVEHIVVFGESIGAAVAVGLAVERATAALVLRSPFTSLGDVARLHYGPVPDWLLRDRYPSLERVGKVSAPLLVVAGDADEIVPLSVSRRLFEAAQEPKRFVTLAGTGHNDAALLDGPKLMQAVTAFLADHDLLVGR
ncbi:MAG: alpha/beta hydrolase [Egibacteraceae bacterium]